jgi:hypothetical protein
MPLNLKNIAAALKGQTCEKMVKRIGNEVSLNLPEIDAGIAKINLGLFSNKVVELTRASNIAAALDNSQYLICKMRASIIDYDLKINCDKIYLQLVLALTQLESLFETVKVEPSAKVRRELADWIKYCSSLNKQAIETLNPGTSGKGPEDYNIRDIMKYQRITEKDMKEALKEIE